MTEELGLAHNTHSTVGGLQLLHCLLQESSILFFPLHARGPYTFMQPHAQEFKINKSFNGLNSSCAQKSKKYA